MLYLTKNARERILNAVELRFAQAENEYGWKWQYHLTFPDGRVFCYDDGDWNGVELDASQEPPKMISGEDAAEILKRYAYLTGDNSVFEYLKNTGGKQGI